MGVKLKQPAYLSGSCPVHPGLTPLAADSVAAAAAPAVAPGEIVEVAMMMGAAAGRRQPDYLSELRPYPPPQARSPVAWQIAMVLAARVAARSEPNFSGG